MTDTPETAAMSEGTSGEEVFFQDNVVVGTAGPLRGENAYSGKLKIVKESHGCVIEWHPVQPVNLSRTSSPDGDSLDWEEVSPVTVGFKADPESGEESVVIKTETKTVSAPPKMISFELTDLKSFRRQEKFDDKADSEIVATFYLRDGSTIHSFHFESATHFSMFQQSLMLYASFKRSTKDSSLYLIDDKKKPAEKSFTELELDDNEAGVVEKFIREPYVTTMSGFSKVTGFLRDLVLYPNGTGSPSEYQDDQIAEMLSGSFSQVDIDNQEEPGYEFIMCTQMPARPIVKRENPVPQSEWEDNFDLEGRIKDVEQLKFRMFKGGLMHSVRSQAWKFLLGYYDFYSSAKEREITRKQRVDDYYRMKLQWKSITSDQESRFTALRERRSLIEKDVSRTDRTHPFFEGDCNMNIQMLYDILMTYCMYNFDLGYVQGMSDLLSPILVVMQNEADAFWCFAGWMEKIGKNFEMDQQGIKTQLQSLHRLIHFVDSNLCTYLETHESGNLYFAFRWLLILFKRDFKFEEIMRLWEVLWTELPCKNFHLLICIAILDTEKSTIMENNYGLTEILKHINDMAYKINLDETLCKAEAIYKQICNCSHLSDVVLDILGIEITVKTEKFSPSPGAAEKGKSDKVITKDAVPGIAVQVKPSEHCYSSSSSCDMKKSNASSKGTGQESSQESRSSRSTAHQQHTIVHGGKSCTDTDDYDCNPYVYSFDLYTS